MMVFLTPLLVLFASLGLVEALNVLWVGDVELLVLLKFFGKVRGMFSLRLTDIGIVIVLLLSLTGTYDNYISYTSLFYATRHGLSTFTEEDFVVARLLEQEFGANCLIISDPVTIKVLCGITGNGFTLDGRIITNTASYPIYKTMENEIKYIVKSLDFASLEKLVKLYSEYYNVSKVDVIMVINNRTAAWVFKNKPDIMVISSKSLEYVLKREDIELIANVSRYYYVLKVKISGS